MLPSPGGAFRIERRPLEPQLRSKAVRILQRCPTETGRWRRWQVTLTKRNDISLKKKNLGRWWSSITKRWFCSYPCLSLLDGISTCTVTSLQYKNHVPKLNQLSHPTPFTFVTPEDSEKPQIRQRAVACHLWAPSYSWRWFWASDWRSGARCRNCSVCLYCDCLYNIL